ALEFFAAAGSETHFEMREALVPWAGEAELGCTVFGGERGDGMAIPGGGGCAEKWGWGWAVKRIVVVAAFAPDLADEAFLPIGEEADAVGAGKDFVEARFDLGKREVVVDPLADGEGRDDFEREADDDAERAERDDGAVECFAEGLGGEGEEFAVGSD